MHTAAGVRRADVVDDLVVVQSCRLAVVAATPHPAFDDETNDNDLALLLLDAVAPVGDAQVSVRLRLGTAETGSLLLSRVSRLSWSRLGFQTGDSVVAQIKAVALART